MKAKRGRPKGSKNKKNIPTLFPIEKVESIPSTVISDYENVAQFGTDLTETFFKDNSFKSFDSQSWIKRHGIEEKENVSLTIGQLKKEFEKYETYKKIFIKENKKGRKIKGVAWICDVLNKNEILISENDLSKIHNANKRHSMFIIDAEYFYVIPDIFKNSDTNEYFYFDEIKNKLVGTGFIVCETSFHKSDIMEWIEKYLDANPEKGEEKA